MFSLSSLAPLKLLLLLALPMASISSINIIAGDFAFAWANKSRTREAPTPTNISTKSDPESEKKGTFASPATAFARRVFPVPGGPTSNTPFGILPPNLVYFSAFLRKSTTSCTSSFAPSRPATSLKVMTASFSLTNLALERPMLNIPLLLPPPPPILLKRK